MKGSFYIWIAFTGALSAVWGQQTDDVNRGVARVSVIAGDVSVRRGDSGDQIAATLNAPLVQQDRLATGPGARAELQFDFANMIRLGANTEVRLAELQYQRYQINIPVGLVTFRVWQNNSSEVDLNTPVASIRPMERGEYRIQVLEDGSTEITVRDGEVDVFTPQGSRRIRENRTLRIRREANGEMSFQTLSLAPVDTWDQWNRNRDRELAASRSNQFLPQGVFGGEQLDAHGDWVVAPPYGRVWRPRVAAGWAPYRLGRWSWLDWYGWTWVSYDPWGWAPYHYGRWFWNAGSWCWWPGAFGPRHFWSPALVSFIGFGRGGFNVGINFGWGNVGWVPLAPFETFNPWWGRGFYGGRNVNNITVVNNVNITNVYRNARIDGAVSYVEAQNFNRGIPYQGGAGVRAARASELAGVSEFRGPVGIAPSRESVRFSAADDGVRGGNFSNVSRENVNFTARRDAASLDRVPFEQQQRNYEQLGRSAMRAEDGVRGSGMNANDGFRRLGSDRPADASSSDGYRRVSPDAFVNRDSGVRGATGSDGFRRIGPESTSSDGYRRGGVADSGGFVQRDDNSGRGVRGGDSSAWQRFGETGSGSSDRGGFVQRDRGVRGGAEPSFDGSSRSRGVGAVDVAPRMIERGDGVRGSAQPRMDSSGSIDSYGGGQRGGESRSGWGGFGGSRGSDVSPRQSAPSYGGSTDSYGGGARGSGSSRGMDASPRQSSPSYGGGYDGGGYRGGGGGGYASPRMSSPSGDYGGANSGGGYRGGGESSPRMSAPSGGYGGGYGGGSNGGYRGGGDASPRMSSPSGGYGGGSYGGGGGSGGGGYRGSGASGGYSGGSRSPRGGN